MLCPRCGAPATPADKFCAVCASPLGPPGPGAFGAPPPPPPPPQFPGQGFGPPPDPAFGAPPGGFGPPPPPPFGPPPGAPPGFAPSGDGGMHGYGAPPPPFGPPGGGFGPPPPPPPVGLKPPPFPPEPPPYGAGPGGFGPPPNFSDGSAPYPIPPPPRPGFGPPPPPPPPQGLGSRCVQGHPIPPGGSFCIEGGHPIALDGIQMSGDAFGQTAYAPQGGPMPPTSAMSGFSPEQPLPPPPPLAPQFAPPRAPTPAPVAPKAVGGGQPDARRALAGFLVSYQDDPLGKYWPLFQGKNVIGRADTGQKVDIEIAHGTTSTHHATLEFDGGRSVLSDLGSTNGTFHNEEAIGFQGRRELRDGDKVRFGGYSVIVFSVAARA